MLLNISLLNKLLRLVTCGWNLFPGPQPWILPERTSERRLTIKSDLGMAGHLQEDLGWNWPIRASQVALVVNNSPGNVRDVRYAGSISGSGRSPWRRAWQPTLVLLPGESQEPGGLQSIRLQRVGHSWSDLACTHICCTCYFYYYYSASDHQALDPRDWYPLP